MSGMRNGDIRVVHREYVRDIAAGTGTPSIFNVNRLPINPGLQDLFPWLSSVARNFESYKFKKLRFCYETEAPSSLGGTLVLTVDYDASDPTPASKLQAMAYRNAVRSAPWEPCCHSSAIEDLNKLKTNFVRNGGNPPDTDVKLYDIGNLFVITQNVSTASAVCGELYVEYDIELYTPNFEQQQAAGTLYGVTGMSSAAPFGTSASAIRTGPLVLTPTATSLEIQGVFVGQEITVMTSIRGTTITASDFSAPVGMTVVTNQPANCFNAAVATDALIWETYLVTAPNPSLTLTLTAVSITRSITIVSILDPIPIF